MYVHTYNRRNFLGHSVTFRVTTARKVDKLEFPGDGAIRAGVVGAEVSRLDPTGQVVSERRDCLADFSDVFPNRLGHSRTRPFGVRAALAISTTEPDGRGEAVRNHLSIFLNPHT